MNALGIKFTQSSSDIKSMAKWFVQVDERIDGPFNTEEVQSQLKTGIISSSYLIWGPGLDQWRTVEWWANELPNLNMRPSRPMPKERWYYSFASQSHGPYDRPELVDQLKALSDLHNISIWTEGMKEWAPLFEFHEILSAMGVNKREFPRADLSGRAVLKASDNVIVAELRSVSEGGFGIALDSGVAPGQVYSVEIHSPAFRDVIHAKAECRYVTRGVTGMKFQHLSVEHRGALVQFVRQQADVKLALKVA